MSTPIVNYADLAFLVIDDQQVSRETLRHCAQSMGAFTVAFAENHADAIYRIRAKAPDVILCDYMLGAGRTGQQLLEELRRFDLLPDECVFMMVTAEQSYEQVVAAVELVPDDYILKPFSPELLLTRLDRAMAKKLFLMPYYRARRAGKFDEAEAILHTLEASPQGRHYAVDVMRARAELFILMGKAEEAQANYQRVLEIYSFPWANAGKARALLQQQRVEEARVVVDALVEEAPMFLSAYDLKAQICTSMGDYEAAQATLKAASAKSPRNYVRKRAYATAALASGDAKEARAVMEDVVANDTIAGAINVFDHLALVRAALDQGDTKAAEKAMLAATAFEVLDWPARVAFTALRAIVQPEKGQGAFMAMRDTWLKGEIPIEGYVDVIRAAMDTGDPELADLVTRRLMLQPDVRSVFQPAFAIYLRHGKEAEFREIQKTGALSRIHSMPATAKPKDDADNATGDDSGMTFL